jgi:hypothetical protein
MIKRKANRKNTHALVSNPAGRLTVNSVKRGVRKTVARKKTNRRNPATAAARTKPRYARNTAAAMSMSLITTVFGAFVGAFVINLFDFAVNRFAPSTSTGIRTGVKAGVGAGLLLFGNKLPFGRSYAPMVGGAFILAAALDGVAHYLMPQVVNLISPAQPVIVQSVPGKTATGEMGMIHTDSNGNVWEIPDTNYPMYSDNYGGSGNRVAIV